MKPFHTAAVVFSFLFAAVFFSPGARAQQQAPIVREIVVQYAGPQTVSRERIIANMRTKVGRPYNEAAVEEDVRSLYATGNVTNVRIFGEPITNGVRVIVVVQTKAKIVAVVLQGVHELKENSLRKKLLVKPGDMLNEANLEADRQKILEEYRNKGYADTTVDYKVDTEKSGAVRVTYTVGESSKTIITEISFEGNEHFKKKELMKQIKTRTHNLLSFVTKAGQLQSDQVDADTQALRDFYQNHGYLDVEVKAPDVERTKGDRVALIFHIREGSVYHVGRVGIEGTQVFTRDEVAARIKTKEGAVFSPQQLRDDVKAIKDLYGARGYVDLQVNAETSSGGAGLINVAFRLDEGQQSYIEHVNIQNNSEVKHTKDKVIRRELTVGPGDLYNTQLVDVSKKRLENLNYFSRVDTYPSDTDAPGRKDLNVVVEEKRTGSLNFGAGFSSIDSLIGFAEVQQSNFDITNWPNFTGGGQRFRARVQYGTERKDFTIGLTEPWFLDYQLAVGGELFYRDASYVSTLYNTRDYGFDLSVRKPLDPFTSLRVDYRIEDIGIFNVSSDASNTIKSEAGSMVKSSVTVGITHDTRDSVFLTRHGHRVDLSAYVSGLGGEEKIYGFDVNGSQYFLLPHDLIFLVNGEIASVDYYGGGRVPIWDRLFLGGANDLRGYSYRKAGPKDENGEPIGGRTMAHATAELTYPIIERLRGAVFYDVGFVNGGSFSFNPGTINHDVGLGVRIDLPIGPVRLDYGFPLQHDSFTSSSGKFNFSIGYQF